MSKENMTIEIDIRDIEEIENKFEILSEWLMNHYTHIGAQAVVLTAILDKVEELKRELAKEENT
mgnify:FL=1